MTLGAGPPSRASDAANSTFRSLIHPSRPLAIAIDDAQWTDETTALALRLLVPQLASAPVLWVLTRRPLPTAVGLRAAGAMLGRPFSIPEAESVQAAPPGHYLAAAREALAARVLREHGPSSPSPTICCATPCTRGCRDRSGRPCTTGPPLWSGRPAGRP